MIATHILAAFSLTFMYVTGACWIITTVVPDPTDKVIGRLLAGVLCLGLVTAVAGWELVDFAIETAARIGR